MPELTAIAELEQAISNLSGWLDASQDGPWTAQQEESGDLAWFVDGAHGPVVTTGYVGYRESEPHAHLIAGLQRTAGVQLTILRNALATVQKPLAVAPAYWAHLTWPPAALTALDLARALNTK